MSVTVADRRIGAIQGQLLGDALCLGSHWYYDLAKRDADLPGGVRGFETPVAGHYHAERRSGDLTHYGDAAMVLLRSVARRRGLDPVDYGQSFVTTFGSDGYKGYLDKPTKATLEHWRTWQAAHSAGTPAAYGFQDGADDAQNVTTSRLAPVVVAHHGKPDLARAIEAATRVCQNNDVAVAHGQWHGQILTRLLDGLPFAAAVEAALAAVPDAAPFARCWQTAKAAVNRPVVEVTGEFGRACNLVQAFPAVLHTALRHGDDAETALLECARAGGDNASRSALLGAWLGALHGRQGLPPAWLGKMTDGPEIERLAKEIAAL